MSTRVECICGNIIYTGSFPNKNVYDLVSEESYDAVFDDYNSLKVRQLFAGNRKLLECDKCFRLIIQDEDKISYYKKENLD